MTSRFIQIAFLMVGTVPLFSAESRSVAAGLVQPECLVVDSANVYWIDRSGSLYSADKTNVASPRLLSAGAYPAQVSGLAQDSASLYYTIREALPTASGDPARSFVGKIPKTGGAVVEIVGQAYFNQVYADLRNSPRDDGSGGRNVFPTLPGSR